MFPHAKPHDADEVVAFMTALGAETEYQPAKVHNSHAWGVDETDEAYYFYMGGQHMGKLTYMTPFLFEPSLMQQLGENMFHVSWIVSLGEDFRFVVSPQSWADQMATGGDYAILNVFAGILEGAGFNRNLTATTLSIWHAMRTISGGRIGMHDGLALFTRYAQRASRTDLTGEQLVDSALRGITEADLDRLLGNHIQYSLIAAMYPYPAHVVGLYDE